jgi:hypothetical protein
MLVHITETTSLESIQQATRSIERRLSPFCRSISRSVREREELRLQPASDKGQQHHAARFVEPLGPRRSTEPAS